MFELYHVVVAILDFQDFLHIPDLITKLYIFIPFSIDLFPLQWEKWYPV